MEIACADGWRKRADYRRLYELAPGRFVIHRPSEEKDAAAGEPAIARITLWEGTSVPPQWLSDLIRPFHLLLIPNDTPDPERPTERYADHHRTLDITTLIGFLRQ
jgi:hypothetical protein